MLTGLLARVGLQFLKPLMFRFCSTDKAQFYAYAYERGGPDPETWRLADWPTTGKSRGQDPIEEKGPRSPFVRWRLISDLIIILTCHKFHTVNRHEVAPSDFSKMMWWELKTYANAIVIYFAMPFWGVVCACNEQNMLFRPERV